MATNTKNFKFKKPDESDFYDVQDQNGNWDMADEELEKLNAPTFEDYSGGAFCFRKHRALSMGLSQGLACRRCSVISRRHLKERVCWGISSITA